MKKPTYKRILSAVLAVILLLSCVPGSIFANETPKFRVQAADGNTDLISLPRNCRTQLTAADAPEGAELQWQIAMPDNQGWVDISGQEEETLTVSIALFASVMDEEDSASIRCAATLGGAEYFTDPIWVQSTAPVMAEPPEETYPQVYEEPVWEVFSESTEESVPETTVPETTVPETTVPETTVPETTVPETTVPETTVPEITVPETSVPETTTSEEDAVFEIVTEEEFSLESESPIQPRIADNGRQPSSASAPVAEDGTPEYVTVTINYLRNVTGGDPITVFESYTAQLRYGTSFTATVPVPTAMGYSPVDENGAALPTIEDADGNAIYVVNLNYPALTENDTINVYYVSAMVNYAVRYYVQNIYDDNYTEYRYTTGQAYTGSYPSTIDIEIPGFTKLYNYPEVVAADGSTEFQCYYDRNYYLYNFDLDGGYGVEPVYARYETVLVVGTPAKAGYDFDYWDLVSIQNGTDVTPYEDGKEDDITPKICVTENGTAQLGNYTYKAIWGRYNTTFSVIYWVENANDDGYSYAYSIDNVGGTTGDTVTLNTAGDVVRVVRASDNEVYKDADGEDILAALPADNALTPYVQLNTSKTVNVTLNGDGSSVFNVYLSRKQYYIKFYYARASIKKDADGNYLRDDEGDYVPDQYQVAELTNAWSHAGSLANQHSGYSNNWSNESNEPRLADGYQKKWMVEADGEVDYIYYYILLTAKYNQNISSIWPSAPIVNTPDAGDEVTNKLERKLISWGTENGSPYYESHKNSNPNIKGPYVKMDAELIKKNGAEDKTIGAYEAQSMLAYWRSGPTRWMYNIYVEVYEGEDTTGKNVITNIENGKQYYWFETHSVNSTDGFGGQNALAVEGLFYGGIKNQTEYSGLIYDDRPVANFFYTRNKNTLQFSNYGNVHKTENVPYGANLGSYVNAAGTPTYPKSLEPDAYVFDGWYTGPSGTGEKIDAATTRTMEDQGLVLFANWKPKAHTVKFYALYTDIADATKSPVATASTTHNALILTTDYPADSVMDGHKPFSNAVFQGWFYFDEMGERQAFDPATMTVNRDLNLFADWKSPTSAQYTIKYKIQGGDYFTDRAGNEITTTGYAYVGNTKTFQALDFNDYSDSSDYAYFPVSGSHSFVISDVEADNTYTFEYVELASVEYTVHYLDAENKQPLIDSVTKTSKKSVIDEKYVYISGYLVDATYKRVSLSSESEKNVVYFYYTKDEQHARYLVKHMVKNQDGDGYDVYASIENIGDIDDNVTEAPMDISGFELERVTCRSLAEDSPAETELQAADGKYSQTLNMEGFVMTFYYQRKTYPYTIKYMEYGTTNEIANPQKVCDQKYGATVTPYTDRTEPVLVPDQIEKDGITYYLCDGQIDKSLTIRADDTQSITYYYEAQSVTVSYMAITQDAQVSGGSVSPLVETKKDNTFSMPSATPNAGFYFDGWYTDVGCTIKVDNSDWMVSEGGKTYRLMEKYANDTSVTFYALFEPIKQDLTITKTDVNDGDSSLFRVTCNTVVGTKVDLIVSIQGSGSVTIDGLYCGEYSVQELTGWSWTYTTGQPQQSVQLKGENAAVTFTNTYQKPDWLHGENHKENQFG